MITKYGLLLVASLLITSAIGCGSGPNTDAMFADANDMNIKRLATLYSVYQIKHKWKGPKDNDEFKSFIAQQSSQRLKRIGVDPGKIDDLFVNDRDGQPFKIRWELEGNARGPSKPVVFESKGVDGKFLVAFTGNLMREVDQSDYDRLWEGKGDDGSMSGGSTASDGRQQLEQ